MVLGEVAKSSMLCLQTLMSLHMVQTQESTQVLKGIIHKKKTCADNLLTPMSSNSFFLQSKIN